MKEAPWRRYLIAGATSSIAYSVLGGDNVSGGLLFVAVETTALIALLLGLHKNRPQHRLGWYLVVTAYGLFIPANIWWTVVPLVTGSALPYPSGADAVYLSAYALFLLGLAILVRRRSGSSDRTGLIDSAIVSVGLATLSWTFIMAPYVRDNALPTLALLTSIAYPLVDIVLVGIIARLLFVSRGLSPVAKLMAGSLVLQAVADTIYAQTSLQGTFTLGAPWFSLWLLSYVAFGAAGLHPGMAEFGEPVPVRETLMTRGRLVFLAGAALLAPILVTMQPVIGHETSALGVISAVSFLLVIARMRGLMIDVAEQKRLKRLKDEFTSVVSHELRTPLTSIRGALGLLAGGALGPQAPKAQRMLDIALANSERLVRLINDILDINRMESGTITMNRQTCSSAELMRRARDEMQAMAEGAEITLRVTGDEAALCADPDRIIQTLTNLISNAIKFSPRGSTISIAAYRRDGEMLFSVCDKGRGIPADKLESVFGRFQQVDASDSRDKGGTGLGLAICKSIVAHHHGRIWVESTLGVGSTFHFTLPLQEDGRNLEPQRAPVGPHVLLCDDDDSVLEVVGTILSERGYRVSCARSGSEALERAVTDQPDVVMLDLIMAPVSGWDVMTSLKLRSETRDLPIVVLSVLSPTEVEGNKQGVAGWVHKPLDEQSLFRALGGALTSSGTLRVLVVEDDRDLAGILITMFEEHGLKGLHAPSGSEAIGLLQQTPPDLIVLDINLPDASGLEVVDSLRDDDSLRRIPIMVYTAADLTPSERDRLQLGSTTFFTKGRVAPKEFEQQVTELIDRMVKSSNVTGSARNREWSHAH